MVRPDGTNRRVVKIPERKIADFRSLGGGTGALILTLMCLLLYYDTTKYLVDIDTGEVFGWIANQWCHTGLYCSPQLFIVSELTALITRCCAASKMDLEQEQQTSVIQLPRARGDNTVILPPLPLMPEPDGYVQQSDAMTPNMQRNYVRDRTQVALTYITGYETAQEWERDPQYDKQQVLQWLQIIYGKADQVKQQINTALNNDDIHHRRRVMCPLGLPKRFPVPQNMKNCPIATWITWIRDESNELIAAIDKENVRRRDPDDPFDGTASGIFAPLQHEEEVHQQQNTMGIQRHENRVEVDESGNQNLQNRELQEGRLVDIQTPNLQHEDIRKQMTTRGIEQRATPQPQESPRKQQSDTSTSRTVGGSQTEQGENDAGAGHLPTNTSTYRRVEEPRDQEAQNPGTQNGDEHAEPQTEDPFRSLRSFHEKQRMERQGENPQHPLVSSHSTLEGAVGGDEPNYPRSQRVNKKNRQTNVGNPTQSQVPYQVRKEQEAPQSDSYFQGMHNTTMYMNLPNSIQNKTCGRCGLIGHIKMQCREDVYCKFCRNPSHSIKACRTYANFLRMDPMTSSHKNTPEKCMTEDIDCEIMRRVQQEMK